MDELKAQAKELGIDVHHRWSETTLKAKIADALGNAPVAAPKMMPVTLLKNRHISGPYEVIEAVAAPYPGVGFDNKLWAGTKVLVPVDLAREMIENEYAFVETQKDQQGNPMKRNLTRKFPLAERADAYPA